MKKFFICALALAAFASCNKTESLEVAASGQIAFGDSFVEIKTREAVDPSTTTATIDAFDVWAIMDASTGNVFDAERVSKNADGVWTYNNLQYWLAPHNYYFYAVSPVDDANITVDASEINAYGIGKIDFVNENGSCDLLYAEKLIYCDEAFVNAPQKVTLQFAHMLSKLKFSFTNCFTNDNSYIAVKNITITDAPKVGQIVLNVDSAYAWQTTAGETIALKFGDVEGAKHLAVGESGECADQRLTIPADNTRRYNIEFDVELYNGDQLGLTSHKVVKLEGQAFEIGKQYEIKADITPENIAEDALKPIEFDVITVNEWEDGVIDGKLDFDDDDTATEEPVTPVALATPAVTAKVSANVVTLTWEAVEGAASYTVQVDQNAAETVTDPTYTYEGDYETEYSFTVIAVAADTEKNTNSEAVTVKATTEAKAEEPVVTYTTVAEFLAAAVDSTVEYTLKGTITRVVNTTYGNFDLTDDTGTVYIYGLVSEDGATNKYWATSGAQLGDDIVIKTVRAEYNGSAQGNNAKFIELVSPGTRAFYTVDYKVAQIPYSGGESVINVSAYNTDAAVTATSDNAAFTANVDGYKVTISAAANEFEQDVTGIVTIKVGDLDPTEVTVTLGAKPAAGVVVGGSDDFATLTASTSYGSGKTAAGWTYANAAILGNSNCAAIPEDELAVTINGKTTTIGTITSPVITTGCGTLSLNYAYAYSESNGVSFKVEIFQDGALAHSYDVVNADATKTTAYTWSKDVNLAGEFYIVITNNCPTNSTSNKDRYSIWGIEWSGYNN